MASKFPDRVRTDAQGDRPVAQYVLIRSEDIPDPGGETRSEELIIVGTHIGDPAEHRYEGAKLQRRDQRSSLPGRERSAAGHGVVWLWYADDVPMVNPSSEALTTLRDLKHTYQWSVLPDLDAELE